LCDEQDIFSQNLDLIEHKLCEGQGDWYRLRWAASYIYIINQRPHL